MAVQFSTINARGAAIRLQRTPDPRSSILLYMTTLILDAHSFLWRAVYSQGEQHTGNAFLAYLNEALEKFMPEHLVVCWDSGRSRYRTSIYPEYKAQRKEAKDKLDLEEIDRQADLVRRHLKYRGIQQVRVNGVEADDLISFVSEYAATYLNQKVIILSADHDLWQLITSQISVHDLMRNIRSTSDNVKDLFGVPPERIPEYKAIVGDSSDNIKGVKGLGNKFAKKLFDEYGSLSEMYLPENVRKISKSKRTAKIYSFEDDLQRDLLLTKIPRLSDLSWYLDDTERTELLTCLSEYPVVDELNARTVSETLGKSVIWIKPISFLDFSKMPLETQTPVGYTTWNALDSAITTCSDCPLRADCGEHGPTLASGYSDVDIMLVGRNPGKSELEGGEPFIGSSGTLIDEFLTYCGLTRRQVYITNVCKCYSAGNRQPEKSEIYSCAKYLQSEVDLLKPKLIITFGNEAMSMLTGYSHGVVSHSGEILLPDSAPIKHDAWVAVSVHPSAALRSTKNRANFEYAMKMTKHFLDKRRG